jgi:phage tail tape-measure protein
MSSKPELYQTGKKDKIDHSGIQFIEEHSLDQRVSFIQQFASNVELAFDDAQDIEVKKHAVGLDSQTKMTSASDYISESH